MTIDDAAKLLGDFAQRDVPIAPLTTYRLGGPAKLFVEARNEADLQRVRSAVIATGIKTLVIGKGSNMLVSDRGFSGLVITLADELAEITFHDSDVVAGGGVSLPVLARRTAAQSLTGMEWAVGVPGSVGGAVKMNAGGHGSQFSECLTEYRMIDLGGGDYGTFVPERLQLAYRSSSVQSTQVVIWARLGLELGDRQKSEEEISKIVKWRRENQPGGRNAGSVFTNPASDSAGRLIEAAGMKGYQLASACVSDKHANFIQSEDGGTAADVLRLMKEVRAAVLRASGIALRPEVRLVGFDDAELDELKSETAK